MSFSLCLLQKSGVYMFLTAGFSLSAYLLQTVWSHAQTILEFYYVYVIAYFGVAGIVSFAVCYYKGPVSNPRINSLIQWTIQAVGLALIYCSCQVVTTDDCLDWQTNCHVYWQRNLQIIDPI